MGAWRQTYPYPHISAQSAYFPRAILLFALCFVLYAVISVVVEGVTTHEPPPRPTS